MLPLGGPGLRVHLPTVWPGFDPLCVHEDNEGGGDFSMQQRYPMRYLPGRPPPDEQEPISPSRAYHSDARPPGSIRLFSKIPEVPPDTLTGSGIPRIRCRLNSKELRLPKTKLSKIKTEASPGSDMWDDFSKIPSPTLWPKSASPIKFFWLRHWHGYSFHFKMVVLNPPV